MGPSKNPVFIISFILPSIITDVSKILQVIFVFLPYFSFEKNLIFKISSFLLIAIFIDKNANIT